MPQGMVTLTWMDRPCRLYSSEILLLLLCSTRCAPLVIYTISKFSYLYTS